MKIYLGREETEERLSRILQDEIDNEFVRSLMPNVRFGQVLDAPKAVRDKANKLIGVGFHFEECREESHSEFYAVAPSSMPFGDFVLYKLKFS